MTTRLAVPDAQETISYQMPAFNLKFPLSAPMPYDPIRRVAEALARQYARR